ncbi:hypothetical protein [Streptomyces sp. NPDC002851]
MTDRPIRPRSTVASTNRPKTPSRPGTTALRQTLGPKGCARLDLDRRNPRTALGQLAQLVCDTAREADDLHTQLLGQVGEVRDWTTRLAARPRPMFMPVPGILEPLAHTIDLQAALLAQQLAQLDRVLASYRRTLDSPGTASA